MKRREFMLAAAAATTVKAGLDTTHGAVPEIPADTDSWFWKNVHRAVLADPAYATEGVIDKLALPFQHEHLTDDEARRIIRLSFHGAYSIDDIPPEHRISPEILRLTL